MTEPPTLDALWRSREWRMHFREDGTPKVGLPRSKARQVKRRLAKKGQLVSVYVCDLCGEVHVGHRR